MPAYDRIFLKTNIEQMKFLCHDIYYHKYNFFDSFKHFMANSKIRRGMDAGLALYFLKGNKQIYGSVNFEGLPESDNEELLSIFDAYYIGEFFAYFQWKFELPSNQIIKTLTPEIVFAQTNWLTSHSYDYGMEFMYKRFILGMSSKEIFG